MPGFSACTWTQQPDDSWKTQCGKEVDFEGAPEEGGYKFCPFCGLNLHEYQEVFQRINLAEFDHPDHGVSEEELRTFVAVARRAMKFMDDTMDIDADNERALLRVLSYVEDKADGH